MNGTITSQCLLTLLLCSLRSSTSSLSSSLSPPLPLPLPLSTCALFCICTFFLLIHFIHVSFWMVNFNLNGSAHIRAFHLCKCSASMALLDNRLSRIPCTTLFGNFSVFLSRCRFLCGFFFLEKSTIWNHLTLRRTLFFRKSAVAKNFKNVHWNSATAHALAYKNKHHLFGWNSLMWHYFGYFKHFYVWMAWDFGSVMCAVALNRNRYSCINERISIETHTHTHTARKREREKEIHTDT